MSESSFGKEFPVGEHTYIAGKMNVKKQFHVARRILPIIAGAGKGDIMDKIRGAATALSEVSDTEADYVIDNCLAVVKRKMPGDRGWTPIWSESAGRMMFDDIDFVAMLQITGEVLAFNLGNFSDALPKGLKDMVEAQTTSDLSQFTSQPEKTGS